jgi:hypothetical protein
MRIHRQVCAVRERRHVRCVGDCALTYFDSGLLLQGNWPGAGLFGGDQLSKFSWIESHGFNYGLFGSGGTSNLNNFLNLNDLWNFYR